MAYFSTDPSEFGRIWLRCRLFVQELPGAASNIGEVYEKEEHPAAGACPAADSDSTPHRGEDRRLVW